MVLARKAEYLIGELDQVEANDRSIEQQFAATKMIVSIDDPTPTVLGLLVIARSVRRYLPGAYVQFLRIEGADLDPQANLTSMFLDDERLEGLWSESEKQALAAEGEVSEPQPTLEDVVAEIERNRLFALIEELVKWENTTNEQVLEAVRADAPVTAVQGGLFEMVRCVRDALDCNAAALD